MGTCRTYRGHERNTVFSPRGGVKFTHTTWELPRAGAFEARTGSKKKKNTPSADIAWEQEATKAAPAWQSVNLGRQGLVMMMTGRGLTRSSHSGRRRSSRSSVRGRARLLAVTRGMVCYETRRQRGGQDYRQVHPAMALGARTRDRVRGDRRHPVLVLDVPHIQGV